MTASNEPGASNSQSAPQVKTWPEVTRSGFSDNPKNLLLTVFGLELVLILLDALTPVATIIAMVFCIVLGYVAQQKLKGNPFESNAFLAIANAVFGLLQKLLVISFPPSPFPWLNTLLFIAYMVLAAVGLVVTMTDQPATWFMGRKVK